MLYRLVFVCRNHRKKMIMLIVMIMTISDHRYYLFLCHRLFGLISSSCQKYVEVCETYIFMKVQNVKVNNGVHTEQSAQKYRQPAPSIDDRQYEQQLHKIINSLRVVIERGSISIHLIDSRTSMPIKILSVYVYNRRRRRRRKEIRTC